MIEAPYYGVATIIDALINYSESENRSMSEIYSSSNRINQVGEKLEYFTKDLFCDTFDVNSKNEKQKQYSRHFSWLGSKNNPPDFMLKDGEAVEVKKTKNKGGSISLNSSYPHQTLDSSYEKITKACRNCEDSIGGWSEKDLVYVVGRVPGGDDELDFMWMFYGDCWAAPDNIYENLSENLSKKVSEAVGNLEYGDLSSNTNEVGKIYDADPCGRTKMRIRGMWNLTHPADYFSQFIENYSSKIEDSQPLFTVVRKSKFENFPRDQQNTLREKPNVSCSEIDILDPENPANRITALIFEIS